MVRQHPQAVQPRLPEPHERRELRERAHQPTGQLAADLREQADPVRVVDQGLERRATVLLRPVGVHHLGVVGAGVLGPQAGGDGQQGVDVVGAGAADAKVGVGHGRESRIPAGSLAGWLSGRLGGCDRAPTRGAAARYVLSGALAATLVLLIGLSFVVSLVNHELMPLTAYFLWLLVARILLSFRPLVVVAAVDAVAGSLSLLLPNGHVAGPLGGRRGVPAGRCVLVLYVAGRQRSGAAVAAERGAAGRPQGAGCRRRDGSRRCPTGWESQSAMLASRRGQLRR